MGIWVTDDYCEVGGAVSYPAPLLAENLDREALDRMWDELKRLPLIKPKPEPKSSPVKDGTDRMSDYLRTSAIAYYCWMVEEMGGEE